MKWKPGQSFDFVIETTRKEMIESALHYSYGHVGNAALALSISRRIVQAEIAKHGIDIQDYRDKNPKYRRIRS